MPFKTEARKGDLSGNNASLIVNILQRTRAVKQNNNVDSEYFVALTYKNMTACFLTKMKEYAKLFVNFCKSTNKGAQIYGQAFHFPHVSFRLRLILILN